MCPLSLATLRARIIPKENKEKNRKKKKKRKPILQGCGADLSRFLDKKNAQGAYWILYLLILDLAFRYTQRECFTSIFFIQNPKGLTFTRSWSRPKFAFIFLFFNLNQSKRDLEKGLQFRIKISVYQVRIKATGLRLKGGLPRNEGRRKEFQVLLEIVFRRREPTASGAKVEAPDGWGPDRGRPML